MERGEADEREGSSQQNTIWKQFQAKAKPLLSPKLGTRESEDKKERGMRMFKKMKWKQSAALDRVISSSQPDLLFAEADLHTDAPACDKPHAHPCPKRPSSSQNKPTVSQLVHCHHKSSSLGSAYVDALSDPPSHEASGAGEGQEGATTAPDPQAQLENQDEPLGVGSASGAGAGGTQDRLSSAGMYKLEVELKRGHNLAIRDRGGTSDPYVKFKLGGKEVFKSKTIHKNLNPVWDEKTTLILETLSEPLYIKVFDYDFGLQDDFMGSAYLYLESLEQQRLGSTCNHVAALLFKVDYAWQHGLTSAHKKACTSMENQWLTPALKTMEPVKLEDMVFKKPHYTPKRRDMKQSDAVRKLFSVNRSRCQEPPMCLDDFAATLMSECPSAVAFQYALPDVQPTYKAYDDINVDLSEMCITSVNPPPTLTEVAEMYTTADEMWNSLPHYSPEEVSSLEAATREQAESELWKKHRNGRITASKAHHVWTKMKTQDVQKSHVSLVSSLTGKTFANPNIPALKYGRVNEPLAVAAYLSSHNPIHSNLKVTQCGLFVMQDHIFAAASPDRLVSCSCCGDGLLEVKCPFSAANQPADVKHVTYLETVNGKTQLKRMHEYYSQVQYQMGVTKRPWCDFFVYTKSDYFVERILFDETLWLELLTSAESFFKTYICAALVKNVE